MENVVKYAEKSTSLNNILHQTIHKHISQRFIRLNLAINYLLCMMITCAVVTLF